MPLATAQNQRVNLYRPSGDRTSWGTAQIDWVNRTPYATIRAGIFPLGGNNTIIQADGQMQITTHVMVCDNRDVAMGDMAIESTILPPVGQASTSEDLRGYVVRAVTPLDRMGKKVLVNLEEIRVANQVVVPNE